MMISTEEYLKIKNQYLEAYKKEGWKEITPNIKDGVMYLLLIEKSETPLQDSLFSVTLGFNNYEDDGIDEWKMSGWCWSHDHFTQDKTGIPLLYKEFENHLIKDLPTII